MPATAVAAHASFAATCAQSKVSLVTDQHTTINQPSGYVTSQAGADTTPAAKPSMHSPGPPAQILHCFKSRFKEATIWNAAGL